MAFSNSSLVNKWKSFHSSKNSLATSSSQPVKKPYSSSDSKQLNNPYNDSSSEDEIATRKKFVSSLKKELADTNSKYNQTQKVSKFESPIKTTTKPEQKTDSRKKEKENIKVNLPTEGTREGEETNLTNSAKKKKKKSIPHQIDETAYKIMDVFKYHGDLSNQDKFLKVKKILEDVIEPSSTKVEDLEEQIAKLKQENTRSNLINRPDTSAKIIGELESRLVESEREKVQIRNDRDSFRQRVFELERELEKSTINSEIIEMVKKNNRALEKNNEILVKEIGELKRKQEEQQVMWEREVLDLCKILETLKDQLRRRTEQQ